MWCSSLFRRWRFRSIIPIDPGYIQLWSAIRTICLVCTVGIICVPVCLQNDYSLTTCALPIVFGMVAGVLFRDAHHRDRLITLCLGSMSAALSFSIAAIIVNASPVLGHLSFIMMAAICVLFHTRGARSAGIGLSSFVVYYLGLLTTPDVKEWWHAELGLCFTFISFLIWSFVIIPNRPSKNLLKMIRRICQMADQLMAEINEIKRNGLTISKKIKLNQSLTILNDYILAAESQLSLTDMVSTIEIRQYLRDLEVGIQLYSRHLQSMTTVLTASQSQSVHNIQQILAYFHRILKNPQLWLNKDNKLKPAASAAAVPLAWKHAFKTWLAGMIGLIVGYQISDERWYWSIFAVLVIYLGAKTTSEITVRALERIVGTLLGVLFVAVVSYVVQGNTLLEIIVMILSVFLWAYFITTNYVVGVIFATSQSLFAYEKLGVDLSSLLPLRINENILGSLAILGVALVIFPIKSHVFEVAKAKVILTCLMQTLKACQQKISNTGTTDMILDMSQLDAAIKEWKKANRPHHIKRLFTWWKDEGMNRQSWSGLQYWANLMTHQVNKLNIPHIRAIKKQDWIHDYQDVVQQVQHLEQCLQQDKKLSHGDVIRLTAAVAGLSDSTVRL